MIPENFMGICDGIKCSSYHGMQSYAECMVYCSRAHKAIKTNACPKKQATLGAW